MGQCGPTKRMTWQAFRPLSGRLHRERVRVAPNGSPRTRPSTVELLEAVGIMDKSPASLSVRPMDLLRGRLTFSLPQNLMFDRIDAAVSGAGGVQGYFQ